VRPRQGRVRLERRRPKLVLGGGVRIHQKIIREKVAREGENDRDLSKKSRVADPGGREGEERNVRCVRAWPDTRIIPKAKSGPMSPGGKSYPKEGRKKPRLVDCLGLALEKNLPAQEASS